MSSITDRLHVISAPWFPEPEPRSFRGVGRVTIFVVLLVVGTLLSLARTPMSQWNVLWAEDGAIFLNSALTGNPLALFEPYAGYMHLVPRVAIAFCALFPIEVVPLVVTIVSALILSATGAACFLFLETRIRSLSFRVLAWAVIIIAPMSGGEVANNLANLHWFLMTAAVIAVVVRSRGTAFTVVQCIVVVAAVGSDPLVLMFLPLLVVRWFALPHGRDRAVVIAFGATAVVQLCVTFAGYASGTGRSFAGVAPMPAELIDSYTYRIVISGLTGPSGAVETSRWIGITMPGLLVAALFAFLVAASWRQVGTRYAVLALAGSSIVFFGIVFTLQWNGLGPAGTLGFTFGQRYAVLPALLFLVALIVAIDGFVRGRGRVIRVVAILAVAAFVLIPAARDYRWQAPRIAAETWPAALEESAEECDDDSTSVEVEIAPIGFSGPIVDCDLLATVDGR
jgi:hypothetical protein